MNPRQGTRIVLLGFVAALAIIAWGDLTRLHVAPPPSSFVGAGMVYGGLGVMSEFAPELAGVFAVGWTLGLLYVTVTGSSASTSKKTAAPKLQGQIAAQQRVRAKQGGNI